MKALIVDDSAFVREILENLLVDFGVEVVGEARNGDEALARFAQLKPDLVILDMVLPQKSGAEVCLKLKQSNPKAFVVLISSVEEAFLSEQAKASGADAYFIKPFNRNTVASALANARQVLKGLAS